MVEQHMFSKPFHQAVMLSKKVEEYTFEDFARGIEMIDKGVRKERSFVSKHFGTDNRKLQGQLLKIAGVVVKALEFGDKEQVAKAKVTMKTTMELLSKRVTTIKKSSTLGLLSGVVSSVAILVLLLTPLAPLGFALLGACAFGGMIKFLKMKEIDQHFNQQMNQLGRGIV